MDTPKTINNSRLIAYLEVLTTPEINRFGKFVASPFFNDKKEVITLFKYLKRTHPDFEKDIYRPQLYNQLYPKDARTKNQPLDEKRYAELRRVMSRLTGLVREFLLYEVRNQNEVRSKQQLAEILRTRGLVKYIPGLIKTAQNIQAKRPEGDPMHLHDKYLLAETKHSYILSIDSLKDVDLQPAINNFHHHALAGLLRIYAAGLTAEKTLPKRYKYPMIEELLKHLTTHDYAHVPIIDVYYRFCMLFKEKEIVTHYGHICEILEKERDYFPLSELRHLYGLLLNFCNLQINKGYLEYNQQKFDIYQRTFPDKIWNNGKYLAPYHFILAVRAALAVKNIVGAKEIIDVYRKYLHPEQKKAIAFLASVFLHIEERKYEEAENALIAMRSPPSGFHLYYRWIATQIYYELNVSIGEGYPKKFKNETNNMDAYLRNASMSKRNKELYTNYLRIVRRVYKMRFDRENPPSIRHLENIKSDIENPDKPLVSREWLLEKIKEVIAYWEK